MAKIKEKKESAEKKHSLWFEPGEQMDSLMRMDEDIHKLMRDLWKKPLGLGAAGGIAGKMGAMHIRLSETGNELIAKAGLPGFEKGEIKLKVTENSIEISAEKKKQTIQKDKSFFRQERSFGAIKRVMPLPYAVKPEEARAKFENGVLTIMMPKAEKRKAKEINPE